MTDSDHAATESPKKTDKPATPRVRPNNAPPIEYISKGYYSAKPNPAPRVQEASGKTRTK